MTEPDSINNPTNFGLCGSRGTITTGKAVTRAALDAKHKIQALAAAYFGNISPDQIEIENFQAFIRDRPDKCVPIKKLGPKDLNIIGYGQHIEQFDMASAYKLESGEIADVRIVLGGVAPVPIRAAAVEELLKGQKPSEKLAKAAAELAVKDAAGIGHNEYKVDEVKTFVSRLVASMK